MASVRFTVNENHTWNDGVVQKEATTTAVGEKLYTCTVCGATKTEEIPMVTTPDVYKRQGIRRTGSSAWNTAY